MESKRRKASCKDVFPADCGHMGHHAAAKMPLTTLLAPLGLHPCVGCGGQRDRSWGPAHLPGLSCSRDLIAISWGNMPEFPAPLSRAVLSPPVPFSKIPCALHGDLVHSGRRAGPAQVLGCRVRPGGLGLVLSIPPAPTDSSEWVGKLAVSMGGDGGGICLGVMSTGPTPRPRAAVEKVVAGCTAGQLDRLCKACCWIAPQPSTDHQVGSGDQGGLPNARLLRRPAWTNKTLPNNMVMSRAQCPPFPDGSLLPPSLSHHAWQGGAALGWRQGKVWVGGGDLVLPSRPLRVGFCTWSGRSTPMLCKQDGGDQQPHLVPGSLFALLQVM